MVALLYIQKNLRIDYLLLSIEANQFRVLQKIKLQKRSLSKYQMSGLAHPILKDY
jgi:hypothetical protein